MTATAEGRPATLRPHGAGPDQSVAARPPATGEIGA